MPDIYQITDSIKHRYKDLGDGSFAEVVALDTGGGGGGGSDREFVVTTYRVRTGFTGASIGDTVTATQVIDVSTATPVTVTTIWRNQSTAADLVAAPSVANLELLGSQGLTDAQLRASAVAVSGTVTANTGLSQPLTDTQLRATAVPVVIDKDREVISVAYTVNTAFTGASVGNVVSATHVYEISSGTPSLVVSIWRNESLNTVLASAPSMSNLSLSLSLTNNELRATAVPVSGPLTSAQLAAAALATDAVAQAIRDRLPSALAGGRLNVEPLGIPGVARQQATTTSTANVALTVGVARISLFARNAPLRYVVGSSAQTANAATSHYLAAGERIDIDVPTTPHIAVIRASDATADGAAEITELS